MITLKKKNSLNEKCIFLIPAYNEEKNIKKVLIDFNKFGKTLVINDNSNDKTKNIAKLYSYKTLNNHKNIGYDRSLRRGITYVLKNFQKEKVLITVDADGQHQSKYVKKFLLLSKKFDVIVGNRSFYNRKIEKKISQISQKKFVIIDPLSGFKCYRLDKIKKYWKLLDSKIDYFGMFCLLWLMDLKIINSKIYVKKNNKLSSMSRGKNIEHKFKNSFKKILALYKFKF